MKTSNLVELVGSGSVLLIGGIVLFGLGVAFGINGATQLPLWASLGGTGVLFLIIGSLAIKKGTEATTEEFKRFPLVEMLRSPWPMVAAAMAGGFILARLTRIRRRVVVQRIQPVAASAAAPQPIAAAASSQRPASGLSQWLSEQMRVLGAAAVEVVGSAALTALGMPPFEQLVQQVLGSLTGDKSDDRAHPPGTEDADAETEHEVHAGNGRHKDGMYGGADRWRGI